jgi:hypothetical protein
VYIICNNNVHPIFGPETTFSNAIFQIHIEMEM